MPQKKRRQVRRCSVCNKIGHNRATCPQENLKPAKEKQPKITAKAVSTTPKETVDKTLHFFVHHVNTDPAPSKHLINLKEHNIWNEVDSIAPQLDNAQPYHFYHNNLPKKKPVLTEPLITEQIKNTEIKQPNFSPSFKQKKQVKLPSFSFNKKTSTKPVKIAKIKKQKTTRNNHSSSIKTQARDQWRAFYYHTRNWQQIYLPFRRTVISMVIFSLIIFAPTHAQSYYNNAKITANKIASEGTDGYNALQDSTKAILNGDMQTAETSLSKALEKFNLAVTDMNQANPWLQKIGKYVPVLKDEIIARQSLVLVGQNISLGNEKMIKTIQTIKSKPDASLTDNLKTAAADLQHVLPYYQAAKNDLTKIDKKIVPTQHQADFVKFKLLYSAFVTDLESISNSAQAIEEILGGQGLRRYLLIFQNPHELRATGGFMGSFALLEMKDGKIVDLKVPAGGSYDVQGQLTKIVEPPAPMLLSNSRWNFHDSNWFPDFRASAQKMMWFYRHSRDITTDGVIAINATVLNRVLDIVGPIKVEKRDLVLTSTNAISTIQKIVETGEEKKQNKPKQIITDLAPRFVEDFKKIDPQNILPALYSLQEALTQKEIQMYFTDIKPQKTIAKLGWDGKILDTTDKQDYVFVVNTNLQGQKSDAKIEQQIDHESVIQPDGSIINTVTITKNHTGQPGVELYGQTNIDYMRLYVPADSQLISAGGFTWVGEKHFKAPNKWAVKDLDLTRIENEIGIDPLSGTRITNEFNKTAFANWVVTQPGETSSVYFTYRLPFKIDNKIQNTQKKWFNLISSQETTAQHQLVVQKQSGTTNQFTSSIIFPHSWQPYWHEGQNMTLASNGLTIDPVKLNTDKIWSLIMKKAE